MIQPAPWPGRGPSNSQAQRRTTDGRAATTRSAVHSTLPATTQARVGASSGTTPMRAAMSLPRPGLSAFPSSSTAVTRSEHYSLTRPVTYTSPSAAVAATAARRTLPSTATYAGGGVSSSSRRDLSAPRSSAVTASLMSAASVRPAASPSAASSVSSLRASHLGSSFPHMPQRRPTRRASLDDDDDDTGFPLPSSYLESKRMAEAEEALRQGRAARAAAAAVSAYARSAAATAVSAVASGERAEVRTSAVAPPSSALPARESGFIHGSTTSALAPRITFGSPASSSAASAASTHAGLAAPPIDERRARAEAIRARARVELSQERTVERDVRTRALLQRSHDSMLERSDDGAAVRRVHPLAGLTPSTTSPVTRAAADATLYPYEDRGAQLASLARQVHSSMPARPPSGSSSASASSALRPYESERLQPFDQASISSVGAHLHAVQSSLRSHERIQQELLELADTDDEDLATAASTALAAQHREARSGPAADPFRLTQQDRARSQQINAAHARVNRLQDRISSELGSIDRARSSHASSVSSSSALRAAPAASASVAPSRSWRDGFSDSSDSADDGQAGMQAPSRSSPPQPPPRATQRIQANFSPYVSASERMRQEAVALASSASSPVPDDPLSVSLRDTRARLASIRAHLDPYGLGSSRPAVASAPPDADPPMLHVGSLAVRLERAEVLRQEMLFLSALFDSARAYQLSLAESLRAAAVGVQDDVQLARVPGLQEELLHMLVESAWSAAARQAGLALDGDGPAAGPQLPAGHAERVSALASTPLRIAASDCCCICLDGMPAGAMVSHLHLCQHAFHTTCIQQWLGKANTCPLCKRQALPADDDAAQA